MHSITRVNEQTSCGIGVPVINVDFDTREETVEIEMIPKGSGSENGSFLQMLIPADRIAAVKRFVIDKVIECGGRVCPPTIVGVGIGGTSDLCMHLAKVAATRPLGTTCSDTEGAKIEAQLSEAVNELGIGPQGLGGRSTAFSVHVEVAATHITMNAVAVNIQCHSARRATAIVTPGGIAGDVMGARTKPQGPLPEPDKNAIEAASARVFAPFGRKPGDLPEMRERLYEIMWQDVGILRTAESLARGAAALDRLAQDIADCGVGDDSRRYNLTWMDRLNLENLTLVSRAICAAADLRKDSRGAHFREDFPQAADLAASAFTTVQLVDGTPRVASQQVAFSRLRPGESLLTDSATHDRPTSAAESPASSRSP